MGWLIAIVLILFILYINKKGKRKWKITIINVISYTFPDLLADGIYRIIRLHKEILEEGNTEKVADIFLRFIANCIVTEAKGEQNFDDMHRDARNVLCIIYGDNYLKSLVYNKFCEVVKILPENDPPYNIISYNQFSNIISKIRLE